jgi:branched-chain amino acid transport system permease protein
VPANNDDNLREGAEKMKTDSTGMGKTRRGFPKIQNLAILLLAILLFFLPVFSSDEFYLNIVISIYLQIILAVSLNLIIKTGKLSFAHAAFMGIGGYTSAMLVMRLKLPFILCLPLSGVMAAAVAYVVGRVLLKLEGVYFVLVTFAFGEVVRLFFVNLVVPFGGPTGITNIPAPVITFFPGYTMTFLSKASYYYLVFIVMLITLLIIRRIFRSAIGKMMDCTRETEHLAEFTAIDTFQCKMFAFVVGSFFAGLAGSLYATFWETVNLVIINVVGGMGGILGPILGAIFLVPLPEFLRGFVEYQRVLYGLILILTLCFMPAGMLGPLGKIANRLRSKFMTKEGIE